MFDLKTHFSGMAVKILPPCGSASCNAQVEQGYERFSAGALAISR